MQLWQMQDAKARLSELIRCAEQDGPQDITVHGRAVAVVLSRADYLRLSGQQGSLLEFMQASPLAAFDDDELVFERDAGLTRDVSL